MTRHRVRITRDHGPVADVVVLATDEGDGVRVWAARCPATGACLHLTRTERAQAEAAVSAIVAGRGQQADLFTGAALAARSIDDPLPPGTRGLVADIRRTT